MFVVVTFMLITSEQQVKFLQIKLSLMDILIAFKKVNQFFFITLFKLEFALIESFKKSLLKHNVYI